MRPRPTPPGPPTRASAFELWTDDERTLADTYDANLGAFANRVTMLLDADGTLILEYRDDVDFGTHPQEVLEDCQALFGG